MCGLVGAFHPIKNVCSNEILSQMRDRMIHRGPDGAGIWREKGHRCVLGHRRLSIIDLSDAALQPMKNKDESVIVIFNGEIYNHAEIRKELKALNKYEWQTDHSDTEVLLHAYEEWNLDCLQKFYGMFAIAIYDRRNPTQPRLHLIRDRIGIKPLYITKTGKGEWLFASEIRALFAHPDLHPEMNLTAFWHYLTFIVAPAPLTMFKNIWKIPAGFGVTIDHRGEAVAWQWWDCKPSKQNTFTSQQLSFEDAKIQLLSLLRQSIARRMVSDVPFGVLLSGGVDSSLNVALMSELMDRPVTTFSIGYEIHEQSNEFEYARRIARRYRTDHHEIKINSKDALEFLPELVQLQDEPIADNVCVPLYFLSKLVKQNHTTVVQVGEGADENFLGYWWCEHYRKKYEEVYLPTLNSQEKNFWQKIFNGAAKYISPEDTEIRKRAERRQHLFWGGSVCFWGDIRENLTPHSELFLESLNCPIKNLYANDFSELDSHQVVNHYLKPLEGHLSEPQILQIISYLEMKLRLPEHLLMRVDKMTMAHSIEARVPFLDHDIVEFAMRLPLDYKLHDGVGKYILKKVAEPFVDHDILYRTKQGFGAPVENWFGEKEFGRYCQAIFERSLLFKNGLLNRDFVMPMLKKQIASGGGGNSFYLWTLLNVMLWHEVWMERK